MTSANLIKGERLSLKEGAFSEIADSAVAFRSGNTSIASVNSKGVVKGRKFGTTEITALDSDGNEIGSYTVTVYKKPRLQLPKTVSADTETLEASEYLTGADSDMQPDCWKSSNSSVADIDENTGTITINGKGSTLITAYYGNIKVSKKIRVS